jgi:hypothetical protein
VKKFLTIALLATVAVGAAYAGNVRMNLLSIDAGSPYNENGVCEDPTPVAPFQTCDVMPSLTQCTLQIGGDAYIYDAEKEGCVKPLYRQ